MTPQYEMQFPDAMFPRNILSSSTQESTSNVNQTQEEDEQFLNMTAEEIIKNLSLVERKLSPLTNEFSEYALSMTNVDLNNCQIIDLPSSINMLKNLTHLYLNNNELNSLPSTICELNNLKKLCASNNRLKSIPSKLGDVSNLEILCLNANRLKDLPNSCAKLNKLQVCNIEDNAFNSLPNCIAKGISKLQILEFSRNPGAELNVYPKSTELCIFRAEENGTCPSFPKWILSSRYKKLEIVSLNETKFRKLGPLKKSSISNIKKLSLKQCNLQTRAVENIIAGMRNLNSLIVSNDKNNYQNCFWYMPIHTKRKPSSLEKIDICNTGLTMIPKIIKKFTALTNLNISYNNISLLPEELCSLKNLSKLIMDKNRVTELPENIGQLKSLKYLKAQYNCLKSLPESINSLNNLEYLDLYDNEFETIPDVVWNLSSLIGLDLEQNYFSTECLRYIRAPHYAAMRENLRNIWPDSLYGSQTLCGSKSKTYRDDESNSTLSHSYGTSEEELYTRTLSPVTYNKLLDAHWDTSEDSADEFDPHESREPKKRLSSPLTFYKPFQRAYCPADSHQPRVIFQILPMLKNGSLVWSSKHEEGQFEDP